MRCAHSKLWQGCEEPGRFIYCKKYVKMEEWQFSYQTKDTLTIRTNDCALGIYPDSDNSTHKPTHEYFQQFYSF